MTDYQLDKILGNLEIAIKTEELIQPLPMSGDQWLLSSCLQKSVRRGDVKTAERAALSFWHTDRLGFLRRLHILALEDVGMANPVLVVDVLAATSNPVWRRQVGDLRTALYLVRKLCESVKTRMADELLLVAEHSGTYSKLREQFAASSDDILTDFVTDKTLPLTHRALSLWYLFGTTGKLPSDTMPKRRGTPEKAVELLRSLSAPAELVESCISVLWRTRWPLALFSPLIWQELQKYKTTLVEKLSVIPASLDVEGLPLYAADIFTRTGQTCFRQLQKSVPELQCYSFRQVGIAVFYLQGGILDRFITLPDLEKFSFAGEIADANGNGLSSSEYLSLKDCVSQNLPLLETIRSEQLKRYFNGSESDKVNAIHGKPTITHSGVKGGS